MIALAAANSVGAASWWAVALGCVAFWIIRRPHRTVESAARVEAITSARKHLEDLSHRWTEETGIQAFNDRRKMLELARERLQALARAREQRLQELKRDLPERQRDQYLRAHSIARGRIEGITAKHIDTLRSFKIETAYDITEFNLGWVYVFGPKLQRNLARWRADVESSFRFDVSKGLDSDDMRAIEEEFADRRAPDEQLLRVGPAALKQMSDHARQRRLDLLSRIQAAQDDLAQAEASLRASN